MNLFSVAGRHIVMMLLCLIFMSAALSAQDAVDIEADRLNIDTENNIISASGNVRVRYQGRELSADILEWQRQQDRLIARGHVVLREPNGNEITATHIEIGNQFRDGIIQELTLMLPSDAVLQATQATRGGSVLTLADASYTACKLCADKDPLWQVRAKKIIHNRATKTVTYYHSRLEIGGLPVLYLPWFRHYTEDVKKHSGFLVPQLSSRDDFGLSLSVPIFWNIAPNYDLTFTPILTSEQGIIFNFDWRHKTKYGNYNFSFISTRPSGDLNRADGVYDSRLGLTGKGQFDVNGWRLGFDIQEASDDLFFYRYDVNKDTILKNRLFAEHEYTNKTGYGRVELETLQYRYILSNEGASTINAILPNIKHRHEFANPVLGGTLSLENRFSHAQRNLGIDIGQAQTRIDWRRVFPTKGALVFELQNRTQIDAYYFRKKASDPESFSKSEDLLAAATLGLTASIPLYRSRDDGGFDQFIPQAQIVIATNNDDYGDIPYRTTTQFDLARGSLFSFVEAEDESSRINLGITHKSQHANGFTSEFFIGQSYNLSNRVFAPITGLNRNSSALITSLTLKHRGVSFAQNMRIDNHNGKILRNEIDFSYQGKTTNLSLGYIVAAPGQLHNTNRRAEEIRASARFAFNENWSLTANTRHNIAEKSATKNYIDFQYKDDCTDIKLTFERDHTRVRTIQTATSVRFQIVLRTLGGIGI